MNKYKFFNKLMGLLNAPDSISAVYAFLAANPSYKLVPFGDREGNAATVQIATSSVRALIERLVNGQDAYSAWYVQNNPTAASATSVSDLVNVHMDKDITQMTTKVRGKFAKDVVTLRRELSDNKDQIISIIDRGIGLGVAEMLTTILSLNTGNKNSQPWAMGQYGQGGSASLGFTEGVTLISSRKQGSDIIGFTPVIKVAPKDGEKNFTYMMIVDSAGLPISVSSSKVDTAIECGTLVKHFGYESTGIKDYMQSGGSIYVAVRRGLAGSVYPVHLDDRHPKIWTKDNNKRNSSRTQTVFGAFPNFETAYIKDGFSGKVLEYKQDAFEFPITAGSTNDNPGNIKITLYVLGKDKSPDNFFKKTDNIVGCVNGQNQHEFSGQDNLLKSVPFLSSHLFIRVDVDGLTNAQRASLCASTREKFTNGPILKEIKDAIRTSVRDNSYLKKINTERKANLVSSASVGSDDEIGKFAMNLFTPIHHKVSKPGTDSGESNVQIPVPMGQGTDGGWDTGDGTDQNGEIIRTGSSNGNAPPTPTRNLTNTPTYIQFVSQRQITINAGTPTRLIHVETDAVDSFGDAITFQCDRGVTILKQSPLLNGRMSVLLDASDTAVGDVGMVYVHLQTPTSQHDSFLEYMVINPKTKNTKAGGNGHAKGLLGGGVTPGYREPEVIAIPISASSNAARQTALLEEGGTLLDTSARVIFDEDAFSYTILYSISYHAYDLMIKKVGGRNKAKLDILKSDYERSLKIHALVNHGDDLSVKSWNQTAKTILASIAWNQAH